jgi:glycosyltransferase involved in cell wall biosynthesis
VRPDEFPRLLFITTAAFNNVTGGGITFSHLFAGWPRDRIATIHNDPVPPTDEICNRYYRLTSREIDSWPIRRRAPHDHPAPLETPAGRAPQDEDAGLVALRKNLILRSPRGGRLEGCTGNDPAFRSLLRLAKAAVFGDGVPERSRLTPELESWIAAFRPQLIYTILGGIGMMSLIERIRRRFALPLAVHFMDDWPAAIHRGGLFSPLQRRHMHRLIGRLVGAASAAFSICEEMSQEYEARYGRPFAAFHNAVDVARWSAVAQRDPAPGSTLRLLYAGSVLDFAQAESLADCCAAVAKLRQGGMAVALEIYSASTQTLALRRRFAGETAIGFHEPIADDAVYFRTLAEADVLLLPVNFDAHSARYVRLSMPTKVPSYLVSGTPVLVYGPPGIAQVEYARRAGWGHVLDRRDGDALAAAIRRLGADTPLRRALSKAAKRLAAGRHDIDATRGKFQAALAAAAHG